MKFGRTSSVNVNYLFILIQTMEVLPAPGRITVEMYPDFHHIEIRYSCEGLLSGAVQL